ncbi:hypothetical protein ENINCK360B_14080 [Enterobacter intestinihominis]
MKTSIINGSEVSRLSVAIHATEEDGYMKTFSLAENEYLFTGEGIDFFGICRFMRWVRGIPEPVIRDLTVGELHAVLVKALKEQVKHE